MKRDTLKTSEFLSEAVELVRMQLPPDLRDLEVMRPVGSLVKLHYRDPKIHYEVWVRRRAGAVEVGLHFESTAETNSRYLKGLTDLHDSVIAPLGPEVEAGGWAASWTRVHRSFPFSRLDEDLLMVVSGCLSQMIGLLEPAVRQISVSFNRGAG